MADGSGGRGRRRFGGTLWLLALVVVALVVVVVVGMPHHRSSAPVRSGGPLVVTSLPFFNLDNGTDATVNHKDTVNEASPWMYGIGERGGVALQYPPDRAKDVQRNIDRLRDANVPLVPSLANITDGKWTYQPVAHVLADPNLRHQHVEEIMNLVHRENYAGIDIDYENLKAVDRNNFSAFVAELGDRLHREHKTLSVAVFAKDSEAGYDQRNVAQDYAAIGRSADQVRLMAYDYHWGTSPPGPIAPIDWVRRVLDYARSQIPPGRIVLGVPTSGYDWPENGQGQPVNWLQAFRLSRDHNAPPQYDAKSQSPWFEYRDQAGVKHTVWFENAASAKAKFDAAVGARTRGVYLWMYGYEDSALWDKLRQSLRPAG
jgi:spore germination protein YaaH